MPTDVHRYAISLYLQNILGASATQDLFYTNAGQQRPSSLPCFDILPNIVWYTEVIASFREDQTKNVASE